MILINLLPAELKKQKREPMIRLSSVPVARILLIALAVVVLLELALGGLAFYRKAEIFGLERQVDSWKQKTSQTVSQKSQTEILQTKLSRTAQLTRRDFFWSTLLSRLSASMTKGVWLTELEFGQSSALKLKGSAVGQGQETAHIGKFVKALKEDADFAGFFEKIELAAIQQKKVKELDIYDFEVLCFFKEKAAAA
jgi:Tfp pilus assembly protein PilN